MEREKRALSLSVRHETEPVDIDLKAYLYSRKGELLETRNVKGEKLEFKTKISEPSEVRVVLIPDRDISKKVSVEELKYKYNAYEPVIRRTENDGFQILPIPESFNKLWLKRTCRVRGRVTKLYEIHGIEEERPLCDLRVHICEVDRLIRWIPIIPDDIIVKIPDIILNPDLPIPLPIPDPPFPFPDPSPFSHERISNIFEASGRPSLGKTFSGNLPKKELPDTSRELRENNELTRKLLSYEPKIIRDVISTNFELFHPIFCNIPWLWPYFYRCDHIGVEYTNMNGLFDTEISYWIFGDKPDLYFWVEALIDGVWTTVYKPSIACNTYWDYECGTEVHINVTDSRVNWGCTTVLNGEMIWVKTVGHGTSVHHIQQQNGSGAPIQGSTYRNRIGLTDSHGSSGNFRRPFGANLYFILQFSSALPKNDFTYYRWSYQKIKNADLSNATSPRITLKNIMQKSYTFEFLGSDGHFHFDTNSFKLGPVSAGGENDLYLIPPATPYDSPVNATENNAHWDQNTRSIAFDSNLDGDGLYEFTLELFDSSGNKISDIPKEFFQIPDYDTFSPSVDAPNRYLSLTGSDTCDAFQMLMRIDNQKCEGDIYKLEVGGSPADPGCCGFVSYGNDKTIENLTISFRAYHPHNFATFNFEVEKGTCGIATEASGYVISSVGDYVRNTASEFSNTFSANELLGSCSNEGKAAFANYLKVYALATNGNHRLSGYDAPHDLAAFALEP